MQSLSYFGCLDFLIGKQQLITLIQINKLYIINAPKYYKLIQVQYSILYTQMIKLLPYSLKKFIIPTLLKIPKYYCAEFTIDPFVQHHAQLTIRQLRRLYLNRTVLNQNKDVVYAQLRKKDDSMISLKQKGKCPGVIQTISGKVEDQIDIVLDGKKMHKLSKKDPFPLVQLYVRVDGKQYRCLYNRKQWHADGFIQKVYLRQYVPGQPNRIRVPIQPTHLNQNAFVARNSDLEQKLQNIELICYNEEYPTRFYIDISYIMPQRPYRVGDLTNMFPPGLVVSEKHTLNDRIFAIKQEAYKTEDELQEQMKQRLQRNKQSLMKQPPTGQNAGGAATGDTKGAAANTQAGGTGKAGDAKQKTEAPSGGKKK